MDRFYTPQVLAERMAESVGDSDRATCVADFAAGNGQLLKAVHSKWSQSNIVAADINPCVVKDLKREHPGWAVSCADFLNPRSRLGSRTLREVKGTVSTIVLNPPFSCRGGTRWVAYFETQSVTCSLALAFLLTSVPFLAPRGQVLALLPTGCLTNQKDHKAWNLLRSHYDFEVLCVNDRKTFDRCFPQTAFVRLVRGAAPESVGGDKAVHNSSTGRGKGDIKVKIVRGTVQMHSIRRASGATPLIHSTELVGHEARPLRYIEHRNARSITGPAVLLPRVGQPNKGKICLYMEEESVLLSDCVIALKCASLDEAKLVWGLVCNNWEEISRGYGGTCAPFITISALREGLERLGIGIAE